jgi:hypothetical protein
MVSQATAATSFEQEHQASNGLFDVGALPELHGMETWRQGYDCQILNSLQSQLLKTLRGGLTSTGSLCLTTANTYMQAEKRRTDAHEK